METKTLKITIITFLILLAASAGWYTLASETDTQNIFLDSDQDGLSDEEEKIYGTDPNNADSDSDGYRDGTEVKSGYNPLIPAPGDKIIQEVDSSNEDSGFVSQARVESDGDASNLTEEFSGELEKLTTQMLKDGEEISLDEIDNLLDELVTNQEQELVFPEISEDDLKIKKQNYSSYSEEKQKEKKKEDFLKYLTAISYIAISNSPESINNRGDLEGLSEVFSGNLENFLQTGNISQLSSFYASGEKSYEELLNVEVPEEIVETHIEGLQIAKYLMEEKDNLKIDTENDPVSGLVEFSKIESILQKTVSLSDKIQEKIDEYEIIEIGI